MEELLNTKNESKPLNRNFQLTILGVTAGTLALFVGGAIPFITPALRRYCLPYIPATNSQVSNVVRSLRGRGGTIVDLGSGDGRIVIKTAELGFKAVGIELNRWLVWYSRINSWKHGQSTKFIRANLWKVNLSAYDNIVIFGTEQLMPDLEKKLLAELKEDGRIIACRFPLPNWKPILTVGNGIDTVWVYDRQ